VPWRGIEGKNQKFNIKYVIILDSLNTIRYNKIVRNERRYKMSKKYWVDYDCNISMTEDRDTPPVIGESICVAGRVGKVIGFSEMPPPIIAKQLKEKRVKKDNEKGQ
jgi:hypothetical protein